MTHPPARVIRGLRLARRVEMIFLMAQTIKDAKGEIVCDEPAPGLFTTRVKGYLSVEMGRLIAKELARVIAAQGSVKIAHDWAEMTNYDGTCRSELTDFNLKHRKAITETLILLKSAMVNMGVNTAGIALRAAGASLSSTMDRAAFERRVAAFAPRKAA